jgi:hypothetical protein
VGWQECLTQRLRKSERSNSLSDRDVESVPKVWDICFFGRSGEPSQGVFLSPRNFWSFPAAPFLLIFYTARHGFRFPTLNQRSPVLVGRIPVFFFFFFFFLFFKNKARRITTSSPKKNTHFWVTFGGKCSLIDPRLSPSRVACEPFSGTDLPQQSPNPSLDEEVTQAIRFPGHLFCDESPGWWWRRQ